MKYLFLVLLALLAGRAAAQDIEFDEDSGYATVDGKRSFRIVKTDGKFGTREYLFDVFDASGKKVMVLKTAYYQDPAEIKPGNTEGNVFYCTFTFLDSGLNAEVGNAFMKTEKWAKYIAKQSLFKDGVLDPQKVKEFVLVNGIKFSERRKFR